MTTAPIRILVADDQRDIRTGFRMILDAQPDMRTVGEAADGATAIDCARRLRPDVVLADIRMPGPDGLEVTRLLAGPDTAEPTRVIVVTTFDLDEYVYTALANGACGFLLKRSGPALLTEAVRAAMAGDVLISPSITVRLLRHLAPRSSDHHRGSTEPLTDREAEVARLVAQGRTNAEIGTALFITAGTAKTHVANIQRKLGARNRVGIAAWVWRNSQTRP
ncbi:response regulator [Streptomyces phyllanthi]|uniref:Response regulator transcription factor n=1 Tax=Streptomyces phyllanthi TaxID=1803180 RepID=A0A5N8VYE5_9ACTN|nr:response regulator transcription factor [Streptomyces phyllanthi]MPY40291.1 response regulator transcription factor [Streptomyces phyllanthi]